MAPDSYSRLIRRSMCVLQAISYFHTLSIAKPRLVSCALAALRSTVTRRWAAAELFWRTPAAGCPKWGRHTHHLTPDLALAPAVQRRKIALAAWKTSAADLPRPVWRASCTGLSARLTLGGHSRRSELSTILLALKVKFCRRESHARGGQGSTEGAISHDRSGSCTARLLAD